VRDLNGESGAITGRRIRRNGPAMREADERPYSELNDSVPRLAIDAGHEPRAAAVVLEGWIVEWWKIPQVRQPSHPVRADPYNNRARRPES
jgi:hypothetical protein